MTTTVNDNGMVYISAHEIIGKSLNVYLDGFKEVSNYADILTGFKIEETGTDWNTHGLGAVLKTSEEVTRDLSADAGLKGKYGAMRGSLSAHFSEDVKNSYTHEFALQEDRNWTWKYAIDETGSSLAPKFAEDLVALANKKITPAEFFSKWGTHYVRQSAVGGWYRLWFEIDTSVYSKSETTRAKVSAAMSAVCGSFSTKGSIDKEYSDTLKACKMQGQVSGYASNPCPADSDQLMKLMMTSKMDGDVIADLRDWKKNWKESEALVRVELAALDTLRCLTTEQARVLRTALYDYQGYQRQEFGSACHGIVGGSVTLNDTEVTLTQGRTYGAIVAQPGPNGMTVNTVPETHVDGWKALQKVHKPDSFLFMAVSGWLSQDKPTGSPLEDYLSDHKAIEAWFAEIPNHRVIYAMAGHHTGKGGEAFGHDAIVLGKNNADVRIEGYLTLLDHENNFELVVTDVHTEKKKVPAPEPAE